MKVTSLMAIERYSHVMHMVSHVVGKLRKDVSMYDALRAYFPHGTVTGAPKIRTMEIIAELEGERRGGYGGASRYFDMSGNCDTALAIRTIWMKRTASPTCRRPAASCTTARRRRSTWSPATRRGRRCARSRSRRSGRTACRAGRWGIDG